MTQPYLLISTVLFLWLTSLSAHGNITARANISANEVGVGEAFQITVSVSQENQGDSKSQKKLPWPEIQGDLSNFTVTKNQGTSQSSQTTIINGRIKQSTEYITQFTYQLTPKKAGTFSIGPIQYTYNKREKPFSKNLGTAQVRVIKTEDGIELQTILSKNNVYVGEQLHYTLRIIPKQSVSDIRPPNLTQLIGETFWMKRLDQEVRGKTVSIEGVPTTVYDIRFALFPLINGDTELPPVPVEYQQIKRNSRRRSFFDNVQTIQRSAFSDAKTVLIKSLPAGAPEGFSGNVGKFDITTSLDKTSLKTGDALTYKVTISGTGQPKNLLAPKLPNIPGFEIFDPEVTSNTQLGEETGKLLVTTKTFTYALVASKKGNYTIPPVTFHYFDPQKNTYQTIQSKSFVLTVEQGKESSTRSGFTGNPTSRKDIEIYGSDIRHIKTHSKILSDSAPDLYKQVWYWLIFSALLACYVASYFYGKRLRALQEHDGFRRQHQARGIANKRLSAAKHSLNQSDPKVFYKHLLESLERFVSDKLNREFRGMTREEVRTQLSQSNATEADIQSFLSLLDSCELGQFGGGSSEKSTWEMHYTQTEQLIHSLNKALS